MSPTQTEARVTYSIGVKVNLGNYQSADVHLSEGETWNVEGMSDDEVREFLATRWTDLHDRLGAQIEDEAKELRS